MINTGLGLAVRNLDPVCLDADSDNNVPAVKLWFKDPTIGKPTKSDNSQDMRILPNECREFGATYAGELSMTLCRQIGSGADASVREMRVSLGFIPLMVKVGVVVVSGCLSLSLSVH
jgi:DNA-directed RNA polymerase beta subunit